MAIRFRLPPALPPPSSSRPAICGQNRSKSPDHPSHSSSPFWPLPPLSLLLLLLLVLLSPPCRLPLPFPLPLSLPHSAPLTAFARERSNLGQGDYDMWDYGGEGGEAGAGEGAGAQAWAEPSPGKHVEGVLDLDDVTIAKVVGGRWRVLVEFYDPSEEASKSALPHVRQAATLLIDRSDCLLARVDASKYPHLAARHGATVLPHFVLFDLNDSLGTSYTGPVDAQSLANLLLHGHAHSGPLASLRKATRAFVDFRSDTTRRGQAHAEAQQLVEKLPEEAKESGEYYLKVMAAVIERGEEYIAKEVARLKGLVSSASLPASKHSQFHHRLSILKEFEIKDEL